MSHPQSIHIKETTAVLRGFQRKYGELIAKRMQVLIEIKKHEKSGGISKRELSAITGVNHNSIVRWRNMYLQGGIEALLTHGRKGFKKSIITEQEHEALSKKLADPQNGLMGYKELQQWVEEELDKPMQYITLLKYVQRHFGTKIKLARKSHIKKDEQAVEAFKKTSHKSAGK